MKSRQKAKIFYLGLSDYLDYRNFHSIYLDYHNFPVLSCPSDKLRNYVSRTRNHCLALSRVRCYLHEVASETSLEFLATAASSVHGRCEKFRNSERWVIFPFFFFVEKYSKWEK